MSKVIDLPLPPLCVARPDNAVKSGSAAVVHMDDGKKLVGNIEYFDTENARIGLLQKGNSAVTDIAFKNIKILHIPEPRQWMDEQSAAAKLKDGLTLPPSTQEFEVFFKDNKRLPGDTISFRTDNHGVHLFPKQGENKFVHAFIPFEAIASYRVGEHLGKILVDSKLVTEKEVKSSLVDQQKNREKPLGEYLTAKAIVSPEELTKALAQQKSMPQMKLGEILIGENLVNEQQLQEALAEQKANKGTPLGEILVNKGLVTTTDIQQSLAKKLGIPFVDLRKFQITPDVLKIVPKDLADKHKVIPLFKFDDKLAVAIENPLNWGALDGLRFHTGGHIEPVMATAKDISWAFSFYYTTEAVVEESIEEITGGEDEINFEDVASAEEEEITDNVVVKLLDKIILDARAQNCSDIHIEPAPGKGKILIRFRKDGGLTKYHELPSQYKGALISRIKIMAQLDISEKRRPQDGKIEFKRPGGTKLELRVATLPTAGGQEDVVMRILAGGKPIPIEQLLLSSFNQEEIQRLIKRPYGLFLVCGPTGSGKTTTLHSILGHINTPERKIWTAEDPVEITQAGLRQVQMNSKIGLNFATAMRAFLRADPDVIMVGEMRDQETVQIGIEASLTGHLVFSTLHTNSAPESIIRLLDMGMDPFNFADALLGILAQRLTKRLCKKCKEQYIPDDDEIHTLLLEYCFELVRGLDPEQTQAVHDKILAEWKNQYAKSEGNFVLYKAKGCPDCDNTGYKGRLGIHEFLAGSDAIKKNILEHAQVSTMVATGLAEGMRTLRQDGIAKVLQGYTDISQIRAVCSK